MNAFLFFRMQIIGDFLLSAERVDLVQRQGNLVIQSFIIVFPPLHLPQSISYNTLHHIHPPIMCPPPSTEPSAASLPKEELVAIDTSSPSIPMPPPSSNINGNSNGTNPKTNGVSSPATTAGARPVHQQQQGQNGRGNAYGPRYSDFLSNTSNWSIIESTLRGECRGFKLGRGRRDRVGS